MISKEHLYNFLRINGLTPSSPDEKVRSVLEAARWSADDIDAAVILLHSSARQEEVERKIEAKKVTETKVAPETLASVLGTEIIFDHTTFQSVKKESHKRIRRFNFAYFAVFVIVFLLPILFTLYFLI